MRGNALLTSLKRHAHSTIRFGDTQDRHYKLTLDDKLSQNQRWLSNTINVCFEKDPQLDHTHLTIDEIRKNE